MSIEDFWLDGTIYIIQFKAAHLDYIITKKIILPEELEPHILESIIYKKFNNISNIVDICELGDCLIDKSYQLKGDCNTLIDNQLGDRIIYRCP